MYKVLAMAGAVFAIEEDAYFNHQGRQLQQIRVSVRHRPMPIDGVEAMMGDFMRQTDCVDANNWGWWPSNSLRKCGLADGFTSRQRRVDGHGHTHGVVAAPAPRLATRALVQGVGVRQPTTIFDRNYVREF